MHSLSNIVPYQVATITFSEYRTFQQLDGSLQIIPKTPSFVIGEQILRPLLDTTYDFSSRVVQFVKSSFSFLDTALSKTLQFIPGAEASSAPAATADYPCPSLQALSNAQNRARQNLKIAGSPSAIVNPQIKKPFQSADDARAYLEARMGPVAAPQSICRADSLIKLIMQLKAPNRAQTKDLEKAYEELQILIDHDALKFCEHSIVELLTEFSASIQQYSLGALEKLPQVLSSLLTTSRSDYTLADLDFMVTKINQLARDMVPRYQKTSQNKVLHHWISILLDSAELNTENVIMSFKTVMKLLHSNSEQKIQREHILRFRKIARNYQMGSISSQDLAVAQGILKITGSKIWLIDVIHSYLECLPDDIQRLDESLQDIGRAIYSNTGAQVITGVPLLTAFMLMPDRLRKALLLLAIVVAVKKYVF